MPITVPATTSDAFWRWMGYFIAEGCAEDPERGQARGDWEVGRRREQVAQRVGHSCSVPDAHLRTRLRDIRLQT